MAQINEHISIADTIVAAGADSLSADTAASDTIVETEHIYGVIVKDPAESFFAAREAEDSGVAEKGFGMSWIYLGLALMFCVVALKFKGSPKYLKALLVDMVDTRVRHNAFDDTVKETSLLLLLNILWVICTGIILWEAITPTQPRLAEILHGSSAEAAGMGLCMLVMTAYIILMLGAYIVVGNVFADGRHTRLWVKGAAASNAVAAIAFFFIALLSLAYPESGGVWIAVAATVFGVCKIVFLYKGFRIFFTQSVSWLIFLYYLCSLEIIPLLLAYMSASWMCARFI